MKKRDKLVLQTILVIVFVLSFLYYFVQPVLSFNALSFYVASMFFLGVTIFFIWLVWDDYAYTIGWDRYAAITKYFVIGFVMFFLIMLFFSLAVVNANKYYKLLGEVKEEVFTNEIAPIDVNKIPIVDEDLALDLARKKLGEQVALGSQVDLNKITMIQKGEDLMWVVPMSHTNIFKWFSNKEGTPGYITVSATNPRDVNMVMELEGKPIKLKYQESGYFNDDIRRHIYMNGYTSKKTWTNYFELDDNGYPYWVTPLIENTIGISGGQVTSVLLTDALTGEIKEYTIKNVPKWVDRVYPENLVDDQLRYWGAYVHGFWNFSDKDKVMPTDGMTIIYNDGSSYYYTGITSRGRDDSTIGFTLVNTRTKETTFYKIAGATENAAMSSAQGKVQEKGYEATFPVLLNIENVPTYFMTLKDEQGLIKLYAMVSVVDYSVVGVGDNLAATKSSYMRNLKGRGHTVNLSAKDEVKDKKGTIDRINSVILEGTTYYYITIKEEPSKIFISAVDLSAELPLSIAGDIIKVTYNDTDSRTIDLISVDNVNIK